MASNSQLSQAAMLSGPEKLSAVTSLVEKLTQDLISTNLPPNERDAALEELKIYGRDPRNAAPIFTKEGIEMLTKHAFDSPSDTTSRNALRCLCNALLLKTECRQTFVDLGYEAKVCNKLKNDNQDDEFLASRIIFLTTYDTNTNLEQLIDRHDLAETIINNMERHAKRYGDEQATANPMYDMALTETLKLLFNVTHHCQQRISAFTPVVSHIVAILRKDPFELGKPLDPPTGPLVNALLNLNLEAKEVQASLYPPDEPTALSNRLIDILTQSRTKYKDEELDSIVTPLLGVTRVFYEHAPPDVRASIQQRLLPTNADRNEVLGRSGSLPSWLLKNSTNPLAPKFANTISDILFELSDKDASKFVENVGYGYASGYLHNRNISMPQNASEALSDAAGGGARPINPVTGQFLDSERHPDTPEMTEAEREREAERLFVLFQRLQANGLISVENPMRTAVEEGRFEELPDDHKEDSD
ncbi:putative guanine nucleotide exchange factor synembryn [Rosellinia necatrix]|uniref:Putative guanine nucleotide exchange factor synembryn n=1 Tax=Rosellinia necatrix TaxID=77044 RepID=A0A1W2TIX2_ROSNE|nr:putative guanine nucleotide exchange factor synembryn [Rosellinia necatrix]